MTVLRLPATMTHPQAQACRRALEQAMGASQDRVLLLDASALQQFDSSALAVLLACRRHALGLGRSLQVQGMPDRLQELARLYGVLDWLQASSA